jgi:hypothetical protein
MSPCLHVSLSPCLHVSMSPRLYVSMSMSPRSRNPPMENRLKPLFVFCKRKAETANFYLFAANGNWKQTSVFLDLQTINGKLRLLFQQTCPSMLFYPVGCDNLAILESLHSYHKGQDKSKVTDASIYFPLK